jgi:lipopolysaccharide biosynthesis protein
MSSVSGDIIERSGLFDDTWYLTSYAHLIRDNENPLSHYRNHGWKLGLNPNPFFDTEYYLLGNPDLNEASAGDPLSHYLLVGADRGARPSWAFDPAYYVSTNPDVPNNGFDAFAHFVKWGKAEGRLGRHPGDGISHPDWRASAKGEVANNYFGYNDRVTSLAVRHMPQRKIKSLPVRTVAFYLPQFHPIEENDRWWGKGFTEWTNVTRARPQFVGHYQPHLPGELGFYDLRRPEVQRRQAELAQDYGVSAFCMYFYWFNGKRLLEQPIQQFASDPEIQLPFCLCWANENWTRRWDGLDQEVLIGQKHSDEDDIAFIEYLSEYLKNDRYFRIDGKPVVLVYRPALLPDMAATAERWRDWCRNNSVGEIYLACTKSFSNQDPRDYGLDAAIEFPPINAAPWQGAEPQLLNPAFSGRMLDWQSFPDESENYSEPEYTVFRSVCPSWDNEARRPGKGTVLLGASPEGYVRWLENAAVDTVERIAAPDERVVFVNAWNEWAEGAHLEPDQRYGYAYLEAHRMALVRAAARIAQGDVDTKATRTAAPRTEQDAILAAAIHAFYPDVFEELLAGMKGNAYIQRWYITSTRANLAELDEICMRYRLDYQLIEVENHGRDVLPFLKSLKRIRNDGFKYVLKLHTKRSLHLSDGARWRDEIYETLASRSQTEWILRELDARPDIGIVGPSGHLLIQGSFLGSNEGRLRWLIGRMGCDSQRDLSKDPLISGTMFLARMTALEPLANLSLTDADFEAEQGQVDATLAHALERAITFSAFAAGLRVTAAPIAKDTATQRFEDVAISAYRFARST